MADIGADGMNGDTQDGVPLTFSTPLSRLVIRWLSSRNCRSPTKPSWNVMSWGQYTFDAVPKIDRYRWLEPRTWSIFRTAGPGPRQTTFNTPSSTAGMGVLGERWAYGTVSPADGEAVRGWPRSNAASRPS